MSYIKLLILNNLNALNPTQQESYRSDNGKAFKTRFNNVVCQTMN